MSTYCITGKEYPIIGSAELPDGSSIPLLDIPMMSDYKWQKMCLEDRIRHPEHYADIDDDVEATIRHLTRWLEEHEPEAQQCPR